MPALPESRKRVSEVRWALPGAGGEGTGSLGLRHGGWRGLRRGELRGLWHGGVHAG